MELHQVRYFLAVASTLNFTRAAEQCNVTQPALTKGIQKLEEELGGQLIYRERQLTQLTDLGKEVLPMLEHTLASAERARRRAMEFRRKEVAPLKIGLVPSISALLVLDLIAEIAKLVPGLNVELREGSTEKLIDLLLEGKINAAMVGDVQDIPARIDEWLLFEERYVAVLAPTHPLASRTSIGIDDLRETVLLERVGCDVAPKIQRLYFPEERPHLGHCSGHDLHLQYMAAAGFGVMLAPEHMPRLPTLKTIPLEGDPISRQVRLLAVQGRRYSPALDAFVKVARQRDWSIEIPYRDMPNSALSETASVLQGTQEDGELFSAKRSEGLIPTSPLRLPSGITQSR
ncbi:LysR family transcriptional regulator [Bradyrhizobium liaoningense]|uniref:LysR family transcriptional regulator n=1 Tax=Bradyrhizobium liaoningense TaxID=43992 RepID=UPI001BA93BE5|nr:LysR family transcriptional regulator [Bradyrhizobium liaoningense]MBR1170119.1 LysR family transcriptional regulator [Bradyrhizobium liaoningense]